MKKAKKALALLLCMIMVMSSLYVSGNLSFLTNGLNANAMPQSEDNLKNSQNGGTVLANITIDPPPQFTPETYNVPGAKAPDTVRKINSPGHVDDHITIKYPRHLYIDISETLQSAGYKMTYLGARDEDTHYGPIGNTDFAIVLFPALWGGPGKYVHNKTFCDTAFSNYGVEEHYLEGNAEGFTNYDGNDTFRDVSPYTNIDFYFKGTPKNTGDYTYNASSAGDSLLWMTQHWEYVVGQGNKFVDKSKTYSRTHANMVLDENENQQSIEMTAHIYDKTPLIKIVNNLEAVKAYNEKYFSFTVPRENWDQFTQAYNSTDIAGAKDVLRTREVTQSEINARVNDLDHAVNKANALEFRAQSQKLRTLKRFIDDAEKTIAEPGFELKYTDESKQNLKNVLNEAKADPISSLNDTTVYKIDINNPDTFDSAYKAYVENTKINGYIEALREAKQALELLGKKVNARIFKYGYSSNADGLEKYAQGGQDMNLLAVKKAKKILNDSHRAEIEAILDNAVTAQGKSWTQSAKNAAIDNAIDRYANLYSIAFSGSPVNGKAELENDGLNAAWNVSCKSGTQAQGESGEQGASVQGLASSDLLRGAKGEYYFTTHAIYDEIPYDNPTGNGPSFKPDKSFTFDCGNGNVTAELSALHNMSVVSPDLFKAEALDAQGNPTDSKTGQFAKYYWDTAFPLDTVTKNGANFYEYHSSSSDYFLQTKFDDSKRTAQMSLIDTPNGWNVNGPASGRGFFPFNYQNSTENFTNENAVYHYGLTFDTDFYIPQSGRYDNNEDIVFEFTGDDDVYVYIDDVLVLDNGGLHGARKSSINFTDMSVRYQYVFDASEGRLKTEPRAENSTDIIYKYGAVNNGISADNLAALEKLHEVKTDGDVHTLTFFFLERGAGSSNFDLSFNFKELSKNVKIKNQSYAVDYGSPITVDLRENDFRANEFEIENILYYGITEPNTPVNHEKIIFDANDPTDIKWEINKYPYEFETQNVKYSILENGKLTIELKSMNMSEPEYFYIVTRIFLDPTYPETDAVYRYEKVTIVPATTIYFEDNKNISYTDGKVEGGTVDEASGKWKTVGTQNLNELNLSSLEERIYGADDAYKNFNTYSAGSAHSVTVSARNNPENAGAAWPEAKFTFTGTGFDLISLTSNETGFIKVTARNTETNKTYSKVVDTYYGYSYGRLYITPEGEVTLTAENNTPVYRSVNGKYVKTPTHYDENGKVVTGEGESPAYAYGWILDSTKTDTLYQIPVIKYENLAYGTYEVTITPVYSDSFAHNGTDYDFILDAIRVYDPVNTENKLADEKYDEDKQNNPVYIKLRNSFVSADSLNEQAQNGSVVVNGEALSGQDLKDYVKGCPNNEVYLNRNSAVSFEIWATEIPQSVELEAKAVKGTPSLSVAYKNMAGNTQISTSSARYYKLDNVLPNEMNLTWTAVLDENGNKFFKTEPVTIENVCGDASVISLTSLKLTFKNKNANALLKANNNTAKNAVMAVNMLVSDLKLNDANALVTKDNKNNVVTFSANSSNDVAQVIIRDNKGNIVATAKNSESVQNEKQWKIAFTNNEEGKHTYTAQGIYENGYAGDDAPAEFTFTVKEEKLNIFQKIGRAVVDFWSRIFCKR